MQDSSTLRRALPVDVSDQALVDEVAKAITPPKVSASSSFILHAPMELIARARLLTLAPPAARTEGRRRIAEIAARYGRSGPEIEPTRRAYDGEAAALAALTAAVPAGAVDEADGALVWLLEHCSVPALIAGIADAVIPALGAAAHAPILLAMFLRTPEMGEAYGSLLRAPLRYLTLQGAARLTWPSRHAGPPSGRDGDLLDALLSPPHVDSPSLFIAPTMLAVEAGGLAERLLAGPTQSLSLEHAERTLLRLAAGSMLQDDPRHAPYGWTHCLTMPQGVLTLAAVADDQRAAIRVAATYVLGFRATLGTVELEPGRPLPLPAGSRSGASPAEEASIAFDTPEEAGPLRTALAAHAVGHVDAHLAKYTLACFDAADRDPEAAPLYLAAAAYLGAWWDKNPGAGFGD